MSSIDEELSEFLGTGEIKEYLSKTLEKDIQAFEKAVEKKLSAKPGRNKTAINNYEKRRYNLIRNIHIYINQSFNSGVRLGEWD